MEKYINDYGKECYKEVEISDDFDASLFHEVSSRLNGNYQWALHTNLGTITVLDRETGYGTGIRDVETGYRDLDGNFWLASGGYDIRDMNVKTFGEAIASVKKNANTCNPDRGY